MKLVTVALVQMASKLGDISANADAMRAWIGRAAEAGADFVLFPECSLSGYSMESPGNAAIVADDERIAALEAYASELDVAIGYGFAECAGAIGDEVAERVEAGGSDFSERAASGCLNLEAASSLSDSSALPSRPGGLHSESGCSLSGPVAFPYNTYVVASKDGRLVYRKAHLGAKERLAYAAGDELPVAQVAGVCVGVQLCWEGHIPDIAATLRGKGAELLVTPHAGGPGGARRIDAWSRYLPARALDNGMFVVACNALRDDGGRGDASGDVRDGGRDGGRDGVRDGSCGGAHDASARAGGGGMIAYGPDGQVICAYDASDEHMMLVRVGGELPRERPDGGMESGMKGVSYFDRRRPELYGGHAK